MGFRQVGVETTKQEKITKHAKNKQDHFRVFRYFLLLLREEPAGEVLAGGFLVVHSIRRCVSIDGSVPIDPNTRTDKACGYRTRCRCGQTVHIDKGDNGVVPILSDALALATHVLTLDSAIASPAHSLLNWRQSLRPRRS
jgi:hypothetical protein